MSMYCVAEALKLCNYVALAPAATVSCYSGSTLTLSVWTMTSLACQFLHIAPLMVDQKQAPRYKMVLY